MNRARVLEFILQEDVQKIFDNFTNCFGIRIFFHAPKVQRYWIGQNQEEDAKYCRIIMSNPTGLRRCTALDKKQVTEATKKREMLCYCCHAGLHEAIMPIYADNELLGYIMIGQFRSSEELSPAVIRNLPKGCDIEALQAAFKELPMIPAGQLQSVLDLFSVLVDYIVSHRMISLRSNFLVDRVLELIENNIDQPITLSDAASHVHRSETTISHLVKKKLGKSFKQVVIDMKLDRAEEIMRTTPKVSVADAARMVGYSDAFHFSSIYKKKRNNPPSHYLRRFRI